MQLSLVSLLFPPVLFLSTLVLRPLGKSEEGSIHVRGHGRLGGLDWSIWLEQDKEEVSPEQKPGSGVAIPTCHGVAGTVSSGLHREAMEGMSRRRKKGPFLTTRGESCRYKKEKNWSGLLY